MDDEDDHDIAVVMLEELTVEISKELNGLSPFAVGDMISFTIRITNTGDVVITKLPLVDQYKDVFMIYDSATIAPTVVDTDLLSWDNLLDGDPDGLAVGESISIDVLFNAFEDTSLISATLSCAPAGYTPNIAAVGGVEDCASVQILKQTAVRMATQSVQETADGVMIRWTTTGESDIIGFYISKSDGEESIRRTDEMVLAQKSGQSNGAPYQWLDEGSKLGPDEYYLLEVVYVNGSTEKRTIENVLDSEIDTTPTQKSIWETFLPLIQR